MKNKTILIIFILIIIIPIQLYAENNLALIEKDVYKVYDTKNNYIFSIAMGISSGDRYISTDNIEYIIEKVTNKKASAKKIGKVNLLANIDEKLVLKPDISKKTIAIYHTHNDESYVPGSVSKQGYGEIHEIGAIIKERLEKKNINVIHSKNLHLPHDGAAYERSRATSMELTRKNPVAIFDIHRDAIPDKDEYTATVDGKKISQIRLVIGRQNPNYKNNDQFARQLKAAADKTHPGLIKDIFYGGGSYNQQFNSNSLLLEFGTHLSDINEAQKSAIIFSDTIYKLLSGGIKVKDNQGIKNKNSLITFFWIIIITTGALFAYLYMKEGSVNKVIERLKIFFRKEFTGGK